MVFKFLISFDGQREMLQDEAITAALHAVAAEQVLPKAKQLADAAGLTHYSDALRVEDGTRPKGRTFSRVIADDESATAVEYGDTDTERRRILGQAANVQLNTRGGSKRTTG